MRKFRKEVSIFGGLLIALMLYASMTVSAADFNIENHGYTTVYSNSTLEASIDPWTFGNLEIDSGKSIKITFVGHYDDQRSVPMPLAYHYFNITAYYTGTGTTKYADDEVYTQGGDSGTREPSVQFNSVEEGEYINITLLARVTLSGRTAQDTDEHSIYLI